MKTKELRKKSETELKDLLKQNYKKMEELKLNNALGKLKNPYVIKEIKKEIARILTILNERKLKENK
ncbi:MAG: 50S ribosomal protein L29 [Candidatus Paceibacterota bacterium]